MEWKTDPRSTVKRAVLGRWALSHYTLPPEQFMAVSESSGGFPVVIRAKTEAEMLEKIEEVRKAEQGIAKRIALRNPVTGTLKKKRKK